METKKEYRSFEQINLDLQIYKTEKEIAFSKIIRTIDETKEDIKENLQPLNLIKSAFNGITSFYNKNSLKTILTTYAIKFILGKLNNK